MRTRLSHFSVVSGLALLMFSACASPDGDPEPAEPPAGAPGPRQTSPLETILLIEDARADPNGELLRLLSRGTPPIRARAARALGRFSTSDLGDEATAALVRALDDDDQRVRVEAAFGLGQRGDAAAADPLLARRKDPIPEVRATIVEALSRMATSEYVPHIVGALSDPAVEVRIEAAVAPHRWDRAIEEIEGEDFGVDQFLMRVCLRPTLVEGEPLAGFEDSVDPSLGTLVRPEELAVVWRALFCLQRRSAESASAAYLRWAVAGAPLEARLFAVKGLARIAKTDETLGVLVAMTEDPDWRVATEAVRGLGGANDARATVALDRAVRHRSMLVRVAAWEAVAESPDASLVSTTLGRAKLEQSPQVRATAVRAIASLRGDRATGDVRALATSDVVELRVGAARAAAVLPEAEAVPLLLQLSADAHPRVAGTALEGLGEHATDDALRRLRTALESRDNGLRLASAGALEPHVTEADVPALLVAARTARGDVAPELRVQVARLLAKIEAETAARALVQLSGDADPYVRKVVRALLEERGVPVILEPEPALPAPPPAGLQWRGQNPEVTIVTSRGRLKFELFPRDAPHHVRSFLELAARDHYNGLPFHRVVPDFVAQGGCYRGDGSGGGTWRGPSSSLRGEFTRRKYTAGSLGMPRNEDPDSGGSQIFVTHRPTPHLDGRYTVFGELREGWDVLARLEQGDQILDVLVE